MQMFHFWLNSIGEDLLFSPAWLRAASRNKRGNILYVFGGHVKQREGSPVVFAPFCENYRPGIRRPRWILSGDDERRRAATCRDRANLKPAHLRREDNGFPVRRPIWLTRIADVIGAQATDFAG